MEDNLLLTTSVGFVLGIFASVIAWFVTTKIIVPDIEFSEQISKTYSLFTNRPKYRYRFRIRNKGKRNIFDIDIYFRIRIKGIYKEDPDLWFVEIIPVDTPAKNKITILKSTSQKYYGMTLEIRIYDGDLFSQPLYPDYIKEKCKNNTLTLEDVFNMGSEVEAQILLFGYDEFSGARKYFISKKYNIRDVVEGNYKDRSMKIKVSGG